MPSIRAGEVTQEHPLFFPVPTAMAPASHPLLLITAHNPMAEPQPSAVNRSLNRKLRAYCDTEHCLWWPAVGRAADGSWSEPGFMLPVKSEAEAAALGAAYRQLAVFVAYPESIVVRNCFSADRWSRARGLKV